MSATIIELPSQQALRTPVLHAVRSGETAYRQVEALHAEGRLRISSLIVDASKAHHQRSFIKELVAAGSDVILDTKVAELSALQRFRGAAKNAPWAQRERDRVLLPRDFEPGSNTDLYGAIARFAVELGVTAVMAPTHFLREGADDAWLPIDRRTVGALRHALDREGGSAIGIDYPLIMPHTKFQDGGHRLQIIQALGDLPIDTLAVRLSGFGADAAPSSIKRTLRALGDMHALGLPILLDHVGGLVGLSAAAFGYVGGLANGIGELDRFDARSWHKPPKERDPDTPFGRTTYFPVPDFDKSLRRVDVEAIARASGGRRLIACADKRCCPHGLKSMLDNPKAHIAYQKQAALENLFVVPDARRVSHFLDGEMRLAERKAGDLARLNLADEKLKNVLTKGRKRIDSMARMYEDLAEDGPMTALPIRRRNRNVGAGGQGAL